jgi:tetratricopeptide (TPR) repeat protein
MLIGVARAGVVRDLAEMWKSAGADRMRVVVIEGPAGIGKTAVVQSLYEQLAMLQSRPAYWPASLYPPEPPAGQPAAVATPGEGASDGSLGPDRAVRRQERAARINPGGMASAAGARPEWLWWGLTAGPGAFAAMTVDAQIRKHVQGIAAAVARGDRLTRDRLLVAAKAVFLLGSLGLLGPAVAALSGTAGNIASAGGLLRSASSVAQSRAELVDAALSRDSNTVISVDAGGQALKGAESDARVLGLVARVLPLLIVVEAAQYLDRATIGLLRTLCRDPNAAGLIVLMMDSDQPGMPAKEMSEWLGWLDRSQRLARITIGPMPDRELTEMAIIELGNGLNPPLLARVLDHAAGLPGALYELLDAPAVAEALRTDGIGPADLSTVKDLGGLQSALATASSAVRRVAAAASVHGIATPRGWLTRPELDITPEAINAAIAARWLRIRPRAAGQQVDEFADVVEFTSLRLLHAAEAARGRELTPTAQRAVRDTLRAAVVTAHGDHTWAGLDADVRESLLASIIDGDPQLPAENAAADELTAELFAMRRATGRQAAQTDLLATIAERLATEKAPSGVLTLTTAEALFDAGQQDRALRLLHAEYDRLLRERGETDSLALSALHNLAAAYTALATAIAGQPEAAPLYQIALDLFRKLLALRESLLPAQRTLEMSTRSDYAQLLAARSRYRDAIDQAEILLGEQRDFLSPADPGILVTRSYLALWQGQAGDLAAAVAAYTELLADMLHVFGPDDPGTLATRGDLAELRGQSGDLTGAISALENLLADRLRVLGPDDPSILTTRHNLAHWYGESGNPARAATAFEDLLDDELRLLGPDDPVTLMTRSGLALWRGQAGDAPGAVAAYEDLLADRLRVLGPDAPGTLTTRHNLAHSRGKAGDPSGAALAYEDLLTDRQRVLGPDHPDTMATRNGLAIWRGEAGDPAGAAAAFNALLIDLLRVLGPDHPYTLTTRSNLARWRGEAGDPAGAAAAFNVLLSDQLRVLGPDHPDIAISRNALTFWQSRTQLS